MQNTKTPAPLDPIMQVRCEMNLRNAFDSIVKSKDRNRSQVIRDLMREYVKKHGQGSLKL